MNTRAFIPYGRQHIDTLDIDTVNDVLRSDWLTQGPAVERFEKTVADYCGAPYAVAVNSATSALHIACLAAGLGPGDTLWTSPNTFVASANCALYCGANVDFVDIDLETLNLNVELLEEKLKFSERAGTLPKIVVPVHFAGQPCEMEKISNLSKRYGFLIIEDASHAIGASYKETRVGSCSFADMTIFSFHPVKIITTGEGGMVLTKSKEIHEKLIRLRSHGITKDPHIMQGESHGAWYYQQIELGFNYRITDIQAALGTSQMSKLEEFIGRRHHLAARYRQGLSGFPVSFQHHDNTSRSALHLFVIRLDLDRISKTRRQVFDELRNAGILVNVHYIPVHTQPYYQEQGFKEGDFPHAETYYNEAISLPIFPGLSEADQDFIISTLENILR